MRGRLHRALVPIALLALVAPACGGDDGDAASTTPPTASGDSVTPTTGDTPGSDTTSGGDTTAPDAGDTGTCTAERAGGSVTFGSPSQPVGLDPAVVTGTEAAGVNVIAQIYDTLMELDPATREYVPRVAESLEPDADFVEWTLTLREGVAFGNGDPLTARAVQASIERFKAMATGPYANLTKKIVSMEVVDDTTLVFTLDEAWSGFPITLAIQPGMIVNTAVADAAGEGFAADPTGAGVGAYEAATFSPGEITVLHKKDDYWDGPVCIDELRFVPLASDQARVEAYENGEFDVTWLRDPKLVEQTASEEGFGLYVNGSNVLLLNAGVGPASPANDVRVRQGLALALDTDAINERANDGAGDATGAIVGSGSGLTLGAAPTAPDAAAATALFDEVKAEGWDGHLRFICSSDREDVAIAIQAAARAAGVELELQIVPTFGALIDAVLTKKDFDTACWGLNISDEQPWVGFSNSMYSTSPSNYGGATDAEMDAAIDDLRVATSDADVTAALDIIQERWNDVVPSIVLLGAESRTIHTADVVGIQQTSNTMMFFDDAYVTS